MENESKIKGIEKAMFVREVLVGDVDDKDADAEVELEQIANFTAQQVLTNTTFDLPLISLEDLGRITRRFTKEPEKQDHGSRGEYARESEKSRDKRSPRPILPERRHIELELRF